MEEAGGTLCMLPGLDKSLGFIQVLGGHVRLLRKGLIVEDRQAGIVLGVGLAV